VLTDTSHKSGFSLQSTILMKMFNLVETGQVRVPLGDAANNPGVTNQMFLREHVMNLLVKAFPNVSKYVLSLCSLSVRPELRDDLHHAPVRALQGERPLVRGRSV
jgi:exportin-1